MYRIIFVDDERIIREKTPKLLDFKQYGFEVVNTFSCAEKALEYIENNLVHVVFTDIKMLEMDGIALSKHIYENYKHIRVVLISAYDDFDYAREAMKYGVRYYLLKPVSIDEMKEILIRFKKELDSINYSNVYSDFDSWMEDVLIGLIADYNVINTKAQELALNINVNKSRIAEVVLEIDNIEKYLSDKWEYGKASLKNALSNISRFYIVLV